MPSDTYLILFPWLHNKVIPFASRFDLDSARQSESDATVLLSTFQLIYKEGCKMSMFPVGFKFKKPRMLQEWAWSAFDAL